MWCKESALEETADLGGKRGTLCWSCCTPQGGTNLQDKGSERAVNVRQGSQRLNKPRVQSRAHRGSAHDAANGLQCIHVVQAPDADEGARCVYLRVSECMCRRRGRAGMWSIP